MSLDDADSGMAGVLLSRSSVWGGYPSIIRVLWSEIGDVLVEVERAGRLRPRLAGRARRRPHAAQSRHSPCSTISCSETVSGTLRLRLEIACSSASSENGITSPQPSHT